MVENLPRAAWASFLSLEKDDEVVLALAEASKTKLVEVDDQIIDQEGVCDWVYLVYTGTLSAIKYTQNGHEIFLSEIRVGELVGELSILAGTERSSAVIATSNAVLVSLDAKRFDLFCTDYPVLGKAVMSQLAERLIRTSTVLSERISMSVPSRLYGELVRAGASSAEDDEILVVRPIPSVTGLARKIHATREATSRAMTSLQSRGLVRRTDALLEIVTPKN